jgi:hypothetical protein
MQTSANRGTIKRKLSVMANRQHLSGSYLAPSVDAHAWAVQNAEITKRCTVTRMALLIIQ